VKRLVLLSAFVLFAAGGSAQQDTLKYSIRLKGNFLNLILFHHINKFVICDLAGMILKHIGKKT